MNVRINRLNRRCGFKAQRGFALVLVLWLIVLMSVIAAGHSRNVHVETRLAARHVDTTAARYVAEAAVQLTILQLLSLDSAQEADINGVPRHLELFGRDTSIIVRRASGLVDLNTANDDLLFALFVAAGVGEASSQALADAVLDWRDSDNLIRLHGAEDDDYRSARVPWTARDDKFVRIDELRYVRGMSTSLFEVVAPYLTVYSGQSGIDLGAAPVFLIDALTESRLASTVQTRPGSTTRIGEGAYHVSVFVRGENTSMISADAVVLLTGDREEPFKILEWRESSRAASMLPKVSPV